MPSGPLPRLGVTLDYNVQFLYNRWGLCMEEMLQEFDQDLVDKAFWDMNEFYKTRRFWGWSQVYRVINAASQLCGYFGIKQEARRLIDTAAFLAYVMYNPFSKDCFMDSADYAYDLLDEDFRIRAEIKATIARLIGSLDMPMFKPDVINSLTPLLSILRDASLYHLSYPAEGFLQSVSLQIIDAGEDIAALKEARRTPINEILATKSDIYWAKGWGYLDPVVRSNLKEEQSFYGAVLL